MRQLVSLGNFLYPVGVFFIVPYTWKNVELSDMRRHISWNLLVPSSLSTPTYVIFSSVCVLAVNFASSFVDMAAFNFL